MRLKDKLRYLFAKISLKETILFSKKDGWERRIRRKTKGYIPFFYEFNEINPNNFDVVVPLTLHAQKYLNAHPELLTQQKAIVPSDFCIDLCNDKERFTKYLVENGFGMFAPKIKRNLAYPYILKKKVGAWGEGITVINDSQSEQAHINEIKSDDFFKQEYIEGQEEYTAHIIVIEDKVVFLKTLRFIFVDKYFVKGKNLNHTSVEKVDHSRFKDVFEGILVKMNYQGICCFNYKVTNENLMIFEINPRYGGSLTRFINEALISYRGANTAPDNANRH